MERRRLTCLMPLQEMGGPWWFVFEDHRIHESMWEPMGRGQEGRG